MNKKYNIVVFQNCVAMTDMIAMGFNPWKIWKMCMFFCILLCNTNIQAQQTNPLRSDLLALNPENIVPNNIETAYNFNDKNKDKKPSEITTTLQKNGQPIFSIENFLATKSHYDVQTSWKASNFIQKGDVLLARFAIRCLYAKQETGDAVTYFYVQQAAAPFQKSVIIDVSANAEWKTIDISFVAATDMAAKEAALCFSFGALAQKVQISDIQLLNFKL